MRTTHKTTTEQPWMNEDYAEMLAREQEEPDTEEVETILEEQEKATELLYVEEILSRQEYDPVEVDFEAIEDRDEDCDYFGYKPD
ncbi:hypothetical protein [Paenibacillus amylolyticus]|uniref:hypothetical protein n=1 Tax=Paenibacillus amylolyticus TaxID=1451 RepID=UPI000FDA44AE|nr:hypothetical protein [Paenibacillus amylolyticus]